MPVSIHRRTTTEIRQDLLDVDEQIQSASALPMIPKSLTDVAKRLSAACRDLSHHIDDLEPYADE